jgi:hypothetical protein
MAIEINAGDKFSNLDIFPSEPTGQAKDLVSGKMFNTYSQEVNFHGNRKEALEFLSDISYEFPEENDLKVKFDEGTGIEEVQINYERAEFKVKNLELEKSAELISSVLPGIYTAEVSDEKRSISSFYDGAYHIDTKENAVRKEDIEFLLNSVTEIPIEEDLESFAIQSYEIVNAFDTKQRVEFVPNADDESIVVKFTSDDSNGIEASFKEQIENVVKTFPIDYTVEMNEPYLDENKYEVSNYIRERKNGDLEIIGIPKNIETDEKAKETFDKMKLALNNAETEIFAREPQFALKLLEGPYDEAVTVPITFGRNVAQKIESGETTFVRTQNTTLENNWKDYQNFKENTSDTLMVGNESFGRESIISDCGINGFENCYIAYSPAVAGYEVVNFSRENNLKLLSVNNEDYSPYGFKNHETWALIDKKDIKIAISEESYKEIFEREGENKKQAALKIYEKTGLEDTIKRFENAEIQVFKNDEYWNNNFFSKKGMKDKIVLKSEPKKEKTDTKEQSKAR